MTKTIQHRDIFGRDLQVGDFVASPYWNTNLGIFAVVKLTPKMLRIRRVGTNRDKTVYPINTIKVDGSDVTMYCLKYNKGGSNDKDHRV